jgi:flagellar motor component MotA
MNNAYPIYALGVLGALIATGYWSGQGPGFLLDIPSIILLMVLWSLMSMLAVGPVKCLQTIAQAFSPQGHAPAELEAALAHIQALGKYLLLSGGIGTLIGVMVLFGNAADLSQFTIGFAIALLTTFYAIILMAIFIVPMEESLKIHLAKAKSKRS